MDEATRKELEELETMYEGFRETAKHCMEEAAVRCLEAEFDGLGSDADKIKRDSLYRYGYFRGTFNHDTDILWRLKKVLGKPYEWLRDGWYCPGCRPSSKTGGLYG